MIYSLLAVTLCGAVHATPASGTPSISDSDWATIKKAVEKKSGSVCSSLKSRERNICYLEVAKATNEMSVCRSVDDASVQVNCYDHTIRNNPEVQTLATCDQLASEPKEMLELKNRCYTGVAVLKKEFAICEKNIKTEETKTYCYMSVAAVSRSSEECKKFSDLVLKENDKQRILNECFTAAAYGSSDVELCKKVDGKVSQDRCVYRVALFKKDKALCARLSRYPSASEAKAQAEAFMQAKKNNPAAVAPWAAGQVFEEDCIRVLHEQAEQDSKKKL